MLAKMSVSEFHTMLNSSENGTTSEAVVLKALAALKQANVNTIRNETLSTDKRGWLGWQ